MSLNRRLSKGLKNCRLAPQSVSNIKTNAQFAVKKSIAMFTRITRFFSQPLFVVKLDGGLGNQLLQYLFGVSLARRSGKAVYFDVSEYVQNRGSRKLALSALNLPGNYFSCATTFDHQKNEVILDRVRLQRGKLSFKTRLRLSRPLPLFQEQPSGDLDSLAHFTEGYFLGFWVSFKYWHEPENLISYINRVLDDTATKRAVYRDALTQCLSDDVAAIHIRRGDYLNAEHINWHGICSSGFFESATKVLNKKKYFIFSDDLDYINTHYSSGQFINVSEILNSEIDEFLLMRSFKNIIISNSTFSYVAALFSSFIHPSAKVVAPFPWFAWGGPRVPTLPQWTLLGRQTGDSQLVAASLTLSKRVCALVSGLFSSQEVLNIIRMLAEQSLCPYRIFIHINPSLTLDLSFVKDMDISIEIFEVVARTRNDFLESIPLNIQTDYFLIIGGDQRWPRHKLQSDLSLALETTAQVLISPFVVAKDDSRGGGNFGGGTLINNEYSLRQQALLTLIGQHGSVLISATNLGGLSIFRFIELALSSSKIVVQLEDQTPYPVNFLHMSYIQQRQDDIGFTRSLIGACKDLSSDIKLRIDQLF
jgi:hypothetical protein